MPLEEKDAYLQSLYEELYHFDHTDMWIAENHVTGQLCMKKRLSVYNEQVYDWLRKHHSKHVCSVLACWKQKDQLIVIEELISGTTLADLLENNLLNEEEKKEVFFQVLDGVSFLHHADPAVIHRDIKPENIMVSADGTAKLIDYNAAKIVKTCETRDTVLIGTQGSAAPEQYGFGASDERTDIYGIGMLMRQMFPDDEKMMKAAEKACRIDPDQRYHSVEELKAALEGHHQVIRGINIPGFRSGNPAHMAAAVVLYAFILVLILTVDFKDQGGQPASPYVTVINRICMLMMALGWVDLFADWSGFWQKLPWMKSKNILMRILGYALSFFMILAGCALAAAVLEQRA